MDELKEKLVKEFSTFYQVDPSRWLPEPKLRLLMEKFMVPELVREDITHDAWARYFLLWARQVHSNPMDSTDLQCNRVYSFVRALSILPENCSPNSEEGHGRKRNQSTLDIATYFVANQPNLDPRRYAQPLTAYLQPCAKRVISQLAQILNESNVSTQEIWSAANWILTDSVSLLKKFEFTRNNQIRTLASSVLWTKTRDELLKSRRQKRQSSNTAKLNQESAFQEKVLSVHFSDKNVVEHYMLLWSCYRETHKPSQTRHRQILPDPTAEQWQKIADFFNQQQVNLQLHSRIGEINGTTAKSMMDECLKAVNDYNCRELVSLDAPANPSDSDSLTRQESVEDQLSLAPIDHVVRLEAEEKIPPTIVQAFSQLSDIEKASLVLWHGLEFRQVQVVELLGKPKGFKDNSGVSRVVKNHLSKALLDIWHKEPYYDDPQQQRQLLEDVASALNENLPWYCQNWLYEILATEKQDLVRLHPNSSELSLRDGLKQRLIQRLHVTKLDAVPEAEQRITAFIDSWLQAH